MFFVRSLFILSRLPAPPEEILDGPRVAPEHVGGLESGGPATAPVGNDVDGIVATAQWHYPAHLVAEGDVARPGHGEVRLDGVERFTAGVVSFGRPELDGHVVGTADESVAVPPGPVDPIDPGVVGVDPVEWHGALADIPDQDVGVVG